VRVINTQISSGGFKGGGGGGRPLLTQFFFKNRLFPCKRHTVRCVHLRQMTTGLINCLPPHPFSKFLDPPLQISSRPISCRVKWNLGFSDAVARSLRAVQVGHSVVVPVSRDDAPSRRLPTQPSTCWLAFLTVRSS